MYAKDKKLLEKGYLQLIEKLGEEKTTDFLRLVVDNQMYQPALKALLDSLEEEKKEKAKAAKSAEPVLSKISDFDFAVIRNAYGEYLDSIDVKYNNNQMFTVWMQEENRSFSVYVDNGFDGGILLRCYIGRLLTKKVRPVQHLEKLLKAANPGCSVYEEDFHKYSHEFELTTAFNYTTIEDLHCRVQEFTKAANASVNLALQEYGSDFEEV